MTPENVTELYRAERGGLARSVARIAGPDQAEDLVHDAFVAYLVTGPEADRPAAWLTRVARNRALNQIRRLHPLPLVEETAMDTSGSGTGTGPEREAVRAVVAGVLASLPDRSRLALELRFFEAASYEEIAEALGVKVAQAHVVVHRAIRRLGRDLVRYLAEAHGAEDCAPSLVRMAGVDPTSAGEGHARPCVRCSSAWDEISALRALPGIVPVAALGLGRVRHAIERVLHRGSALAEPGTQLAHVAVAFGIAAATFVPAAASVTASPLRSATTPVTAQAAPPSQPTVTGTATAPKPAVATRRATTTTSSSSSQSVVGGPVNVTTSDSHTQAQAGTGSGSAGAVVCKPLEPCPPPPTPGVQS